MEAVGGGHVELVKLLLQHPDLDVNAQTISKSPFMIWASQEKVTTDMLQLINRCTVK
jgi:hypothetical protein